MCIKEYKKKIIYMGDDPRNIEPVNHFLKEKENEIQILKKKSRIPEAWHIKTLELITLQSEKDEFYKYMVKFKEWVNKYWDQRDQYKSKLNLIKKEKIELQAFKYSIVSTRQKYTQ